MVGSDIRATVAAGAPVTDRRPRRVGLLDNPRSGGNRRRPGALTRVLAEHPSLRRHVVESPADVAGALADFAHHGIDVVAINGGDGTIQAALTVVLGERVFDTPPAFAVLTAGTTSMISRDVGLRGARAGALRRLLDWARSPDARARLLERTILRLEHSPDAPPQFGMFFGAAAIEQGIRFCLTRIHTLGVSGELGAGLALAALLGGLARGRQGLVTPVALTTSLDGAPPERREHLVLMISTLERLVVGLRPFWGDGAAPLHYTAVMGRPRRLLAALPRVLRGRPGGPATADNGYVSRDVREARVWLEGSGYTLDGEMFTGQPGQGPVVLRAGGRATFVRC
jgi:diacylglycerol kinase (ATP)